MRLSVVYVQHVLCCISNAAFLHATVLLEGDSKVSPDVTVLITKYN